MPSDRYSHKNQSADVVVMLIETSNYLYRLEANQYSIFTQKFHLSVNKTLKEYDGYIVNTDNNSYLVTFNLVTDAIQCALKIRYKFKYVTPKFDEKQRRLKVALSSYTPLAKKNVISEEAIILATRICEVLEDQLVVSNKVKEWFDSENESAAFDNDLIRALKDEEEKFLNDLMDYMEAGYNKPGFILGEFAKASAYSKSKIYRKLKKLAGKSPRAFIREFRLHKALELLHNHSGNISEIAITAGFNSATYFSKCFRNKYGILPSTYRQQHAI